MNQYGHSPRAKFKKDMIFGPSQMVMRDADIYVEKFGKNLPCDLREKMRNRLVQVFKKDGNKK